MVAAAVPFVGERLLDAADAVVEGIGGVGRAARELPAALLDDPAGSNRLRVSGDCDGSEQRWGVVVPAWGSLEPSRRDGENAQKTGKNGGEMGEIWSN